MFCSKCGTEVPNGSNFCMKCGYSFAVAAAASAQPVPEPVQAPVPGGPPPVIDGIPWVQNSGVVNPFPVPGFDQYNPTFHCRCEYCYYEFNYHTYDLGYRAWYPHGFIYCPRCKKPIRHRLEFEVGFAVPDQQPGAPAPYPVAITAATAPAPAPVVAAPVAPAPAPAPASPVTAAPSVPLPEPEPDAPAKAKSDDDDAAAIAAATTTSTT